ncbi:unnamed protein product [Mytilus coruscus]|uniref:EGF-like domain-containing protein n=1 Tax=Mytilus coruscus TaxID=42192 RepID=A0A6J8ARE4_MYTCO|nr:unnamed protein product [Mytilus coruscus]
MDQCSQYVSSFCTGTLIVLYILAATHCSELNGTSSNTDASNNDTDLIESSNNQSYSIPLYNKSYIEKSENVLDAQAYSLAFSSNRSTEIQNILQDSQFNISTSIDVGCHAPCCNQNDDNRDFRCILDRSLQNSQYNCSHFFIIMTEQSCKLNFTFCINNYTDILRPNSGNKSGLSTHNYSWLDLLNILSLVDIDDCTFSLNDLQNVEQKYECILLHNNGCSENASIYDISCEHVTCREDLLGEFCLTYTFDTHHIQIIFYKSRFCDENNHKTKCSEHCNDGDCNNTTGECSFCKFGWFGNECAHRCLNNCKICIDNSTCLECIEGFYGNICEHPCSNDCHICSKDGKVCDSCKTNNDFGPQCACKVNECYKYSPMLRCLECKQHGWYVSLGGCCPCSNNCEGGFASCDNRTGTCSDGCIDGYYGNTCSDKCSSHCLENHTKCNSLTGECENGCEQNWYSSTCSYECSLFYPHCDTCSNITDFEMKCVKCMDGYYMPQKYRLTDNKRSYLSDHCFTCNHCLNKKCDGFNGVCTEGCKLKGRYNSDDYIFGEKNCVLECISCWNQSCDFINGTCLDGCVHGLYGSHCDLPCSESCVNGTCDQISGDCLSCNVGYYGPRCKNNCGHCEKIGCDQYTGECDGGCLPGFYGNKCEEMCSNCVGYVCNQKGKCVHGCNLSQYGPFCDKQCSIDCLICHPVNGDCIVSNLTSRTEYHILNKSTTACPPNKFGMHCERYCGIGCKKTDQGLSICDKYTGFCDQCLQGFHGIACGNRCNTTCIDGDCNRDGICAKGCVYRWQGKYCQNHFPITVFEEVSGILFGVMCAIVFFVGVLCVMHKKRYDCLICLRVKVNVLDAQSESNMTNLMHLKSLYIPD